MTNVREPLINSVSRNRLRLLMSLDQKVRDQVTPFTSGSTSMLYRRRIGGVYVARVIQMELGKPVSSLVKISNANRKER